VYVVANLKETQLDRVMVGQPVALDVDAFDGEPLSGHVESFAPASGAQFALLPPDNATGNFTKIVQRLPVRISIDPGQHRAADLRPGLSVVARIDTRRGEAQR
ncbi:MAG: HlyD family secretion protein, partial [Bradyrhizobium sp.]